MQCKRNVQDAIIIVTGIFTYYGASSSENNKIHKTEQTLVHFALSD
jgi:hypothetical protein